MPDLTAGVPAGRASVTISGVEFIQRWSCVSLSLSGVFILASHSFWAASRSGEVPSARTLTTRAHILSQFVSGLLRPAVTFILAFSASSRVANVRPCHSHRCWSRCHTRQITTPFSERELAAFVCRGRVMAFLVCQQSARGAARPYRVAVRSCSPISMLLSHTLDGLLSLARSGLRLCDISSGQLSPRRFRRHPRSTKHPHGA